MKRDYFLKLRDAASSKVKRWAYACATLALCPIVGHETGRQGRKKEKGKRQVFTAEGETEEISQIPVGQLVLGKLRQCKGEHCCLLKFYLDEKASN